MDNLQLATLSITGALAGWLNVMAGGGSLLTVPAMLFMGIPAPVANGSNRIGILMEGVAAVASFHRRGFSDFRLSLSLAATASLGAAGGAMLGVKLDGVWFDRLLALAIIAVMILMAGGNKSHAPAAETDGKPKRLLLGHICMIGAGFWGGLIQVGVGFILMPILHRVMGLDLVRVNMHKVFVVLVYTLIALLIFAGSVEILWSAGLALGLGMMLGAWLGAHTAIRHGELWIRRVLFATLALITVKLLWP